MPWFNHHSQQAPPAVSILLVHTGLQAGICRLEDAQADFVQAVEIFLALRFIGEHGDTVDNQAQLPDLTFPLRDPDGC